MSRIKKKQEHKEECIIKNQTGNISDDTWETFEQYKIRCEVYKYIWGRSLEHFHKSLQSHEPPKVKESYRSDHNKKTKQ